MKWENENPFVIFILPLPLSFPFCLAPMNRFLLTCARQSRLPGRSTSIFARQSALVSMTQRLPFSSAPPTTEQRLPLAQILDQEVDYELKNTADAQKSLDVLPDNLQTLLKSSGFKVISIGTSE
jgi:hypothetical protein